MYSLSNSYVGEGIVRKYGSSAKSVGAREVFALPESLKWPEIRMAYK